MIAHNRSMGLRCVQYGGSWIRWILHSGRAKKARPNAWEMLVQSLEMITGQKFETPDQLKAWMEENEAELKRRGL